MYLFLMQEASDSLTIGSVSPVMEDSSQSNSEAWITKPSAGRSIPSEIRTISPTKRLEWWRVVICPSRITESYN